MYDDPIESGEEFPLGIEPIDKYLTRAAAKIAHERARTENRIALILIISVVASLPVYFLAIWIRPDSAVELKEAYDRWLMIIGPLAGAAVGIGAMVRTGTST